jgi:hypothetical protein
MRHPIRRTRVAPQAAGALLVVLMAGLACGGKRPVPVQILVPPQLDVKQYGRVGLVLFTVERAKGDMDDFATRRFAENILAAQPGVEVLEVGTADSIRRRVGEREYGPATLQALGAARGLPVVFVGHLKVSDVTPSGGLRGLAMPRVEARISADLRVGLFSTESGGTLWRASGSASRKIGGLSIIGGEPVFSAKDPNSEYAKLVRDLVDYVAADLRATWTTR